MRISSIISVVKSQFVSKKQVKSPKESKLNIKDSVKISQKGRLLQKDKADFLIAKNALSRLPSVRQDKVKAAQEKIKNNEYNSASFKSKLLNKIVGSGLFSNEIQKTGIKSIQKSIPNVRESKLNQVRERINVNYYKRSDVVRDLSDRILEEFNL
ncbi:flagellar biosynthesis anti-sigma factor FlgM [bacterium]|nr:flagellar biosynthesis anti-sigma factor FlgM [bacterium]